MIVLIPYYNFEANESLRENHLQSVQKVIAEGYTCVTVEAVLDGRKPLQMETSKTNHHIRLATKSALWHKESLINVGRKMLIRIGLHDGKLLWIDSGCYLGDGVLALTESLLDEVDLIQPWTRVDYLSQNGNSIDKSYPGGVFADQATKSKHFAPGGAWAATDRFFEISGGLYDKMIVGGGDSIFFEAVSRKNTAPPVPFSASMQKDVEKWSKRVIAGKVKAAYVPGTLYHIWHMADKNRQHKSRRFILVDGEFDTNADVRRAENGLLEWVDPASEMAQKVTSYMKGRTDVSNN